MINDKNCPICKSEISEDRLKFSPVICNHCGNIDAESHNNFNEKTTKISIITFIVLSVVITGSFLQSVRWGKHSLAVIPHKTAIAFGVATDNNHQALQQICTDRKMRNCVQSSLEEQLFESPNNLDVLKKLGKLYFERKNYSKAFDSFNAYFNNEGKDLFAAYYFAKTLSLQGEIEKASNFFKYVLSAKPDVLQVTVTAAYMDMLIANNRFNDAKKLARSVEARTEKIPGTLASRFSKVEKALNSANN